MIEGVTHASDVPYSSNQFLGWDFFCRFLQQDDSRKTLTDIVDQVKLSGPDRHYQRSTNVQLENENYFELTRKSSLFSSHHIFT